MTGSEFDSKRLLILGVPDSYCVGGCCLDDGGLPPSFLVLKQHRRVWNLKKKKTWASERGEDQQLSYKERKETNEQRQQLDY